MEIVALTTAAIAIGTQWVTKLLNKQPTDVSPYFSRNGEYQANVNRQKTLYNDAFSKYASQLPEGSSEATEFLQICKPSLDWMGQRNQPGLTSVATINSEGQRLLDKYQSSIMPVSVSNIINTALNPDTLTKISDPIQNFFSYFSTKLTELEQSFLGVPKTDTVIPIVLTQEPQTAPQITVEQPAITIEQKEATAEKTGFEKFALPVGIAVVSGIVLFMVRR